MNEWRVLPLAIADQQQHIACSEQLLACVSVEDPATLYWSIAQPPALVLGFSQKHDILNQEAVTAHGIPIYHRRAGGAAVLVGPQLLGLDVVLPAHHPLVLSDIVESYRWLGETWVETLRALGVQTRAIPIQEARQQRLLLQQDATREREILLRRACYGSLSPYEVVKGQRKVVGLDMIRRKHATLLQAGVLLQWQPNLLAQLLAHNEQEQQTLREGLRERAIGLNTLAGRFVSAQEVIAAFEQTIFARL